MASWITVFTTSAVVMGLSYTIARERIFAPLRDRLGGKKTWLGYLLSCPYCNSHWLAFLLVPLTGAYGVQLAVHWGLLGRIVEWFLSSILVTVIAAFLRIFFFAIDEQQGLIRRERQQVETQTARLGAAAATPPQTGADVHPPH